jgi:DNA/RNA endonuclease YhcR with UshA esterase domain
MKSRFSAFGPLVVLGLCLYATPTHAQTAEGTPGSVVAPKYDITREVTLTGTVSSLVKNTTPEMQMLGGSHLIVQTTSGKIDASLGGYAMKAVGALSVTPGQQVQVTGVMKTIRDQQVFVTRLVQVNGRVYKIRNEHGFVLAPGPRKGVTKPEAKGGQL